MAWNPRATLPAVIAVTLLGGALAFVAAGAPPLTGIDDANIYLVYARNLAGGHGLVFTPGAERVEGATSIVWAVIGSLAFRVSEAPEPVLLGVNFALTCLALALVLDVLRRGLHAEGEPPRGGGIAVLALGVLVLLGTPAFFTWTVLTLMDTALWTACLAALGATLAHALLAPVRSSLGWSAGVSVLAALALWVRPEGLLVVPLMLLAFVLTHPDPVRRGLLRVAVPAGGAAAAAAGLIGFRLRYFGSPLPNTYYAKVSPDLAYRVRGGALYLYWFTRENIWLVPVLLLALVALARAVRARRRGPGASLSPQERVAAFSAGVVAAGLAIPFGTGGDHFHGHRVLQPFLPWLAVPLASEVVRFLGGPVADGLAPRVRTRTFALVAAASLTALLANRWMEFRRLGGVRHEFRIALDGRAMGSALNALVSRPSDVRVAAYAVGGLAYAYQGRVVDLLGLNWVAMARAEGDRKGLFGHSGFSPGPFFEEGPEIVIPLRLGATLDVGAFTTCEASRSWVNANLEGLYGDPRFRREYQPVVARLARGDEGWLMAYARRAWLDGAGGSGFERLPWDGGGCRGLLEPPGH